MVSFSASINLPLHHRVQNFSSGTGSPGWSQKKGRKMVVVCGCGFIIAFIYLAMYEVIDILSLLSVVVKIQ